MAEMGLDRGCTVSIGPCLLQHPWLSSHIEVYSTCNRCLSVGVQAAVRSALLIVIPAGLQPPSWLTEGWAACARVTLYSRVTPASFISETLAVDEPNRIWSLLSLVCGSSYRCSCGSSLIFGLCRLGNAGRAFKATTQKPRNLKQICA